MSSENAAECIHGQVSDDALVVGKTYTVYAIAVWSGRPVLFVENEHHLSYPHPYDATLFSVESGVPSSLWEICLTPSMFIGPQAWVRTPYFGDKLTDGDPVAVAQFAKFKGLMDLEFEDASVSQTATILDDKWIQCPDCQDAWESESTYAMVRCPTCAGVFRNPRFVVSP